MLPRHIWVRKSPSPDMQVVAGCSVSGRTSPNRGRAAMTDGGFHGHTSDLPEGWADRPSFDPKKPLLERLIEYGLSPERAAYMVAKQAEPSSAEQEELRLGLIRCGFPPERAAAEAARLAREGMRQVGPDR